MKLGVQKIHQQHGERKEGENGNGPGDSQKEADLTVCQPLGNQGVRIAHQQSPQLGRHGWALALVLFSHWLMPP